jgi:predicted HD phosphohydrolase
LFQNYYYVHFRGGNRNERDKFLDHPWYGACKSFCADWDQCSFDPEYPSLPLTAFEPLVHEIFTRKPHDPRYLAGAQTAPPASS